MVFSRSFCKCLIFKFLICILPKAKQVDFVANMLENKDKNTNIGGLNFTDFRGDAIVLASSDSKIDYYSFQILLMEARQGKDVGTRMPTHGTKFLGHCFSSQKIKFYLFFY